MTHFRSTPLAFTVTALTLCAAQSTARAQTPADLTSVSVAYSTRKAQAKPDGELKARLDSLERLISAASRVGRTGEVRRLYAQATTVLAGRAWTDSLEFAASLRLRTDRVVIETERPYELRLEQTYAPRVDFRRALTAHAVLRKRPTAAEPVGDVVKDFDLFDGVGRDLVESPLSMELDLRNIADGNYTFYVEVLDSARVIARPALPVTLRKGLDAQLARLDKEAAAAPAALRGELLFPGDRMHAVNRGLLPASTFNADRDIAIAESLLAVVKAGKDPFVGKTGDFKRHYVLDAAKEVMPYHVYVPTAYKRATPMPLVIALHGLGGTEDDFFNGYGKKLPQLAEERGYIVAAPLGYRVDGFYGSRYGGSPRRAELSEMDVLAVLAEMRKNYNIDPTRIYLMGHSMGAIGTWSIAAKHPDVWAALGVFSGLGDSSTATSMKKIPEFVVHGDADPTVNVSGSRNMVAALKGAGANVMYTEVPGGNHISVVEPNLAAMFDFFGALKPKP